MTADIKSKISNYMKRIQVQAYWRYPGQGNKPDNYYLEGAERTAFLVKHVTKYVPLDARILEIGCNMGRNLYGLYNAGYKRLEGIEINKSAVKLMEKNYPDMCKSPIIKEDRHRPDVNIYNRPVESVIGGLSDDYGLVYSMAVLEHIPPASEWILKEMSRLAVNGYIITIEDEKNFTSRHWARNYREIFEKLGRTQLYEKNCSNVKGLGDTFWLRIFK